LTAIAPVAVIIPTFNRGMAVLSVLEKVKICDPKPAEIWIHIDLADGTLEGQLRRKHPDIRVLTSPTRLGPGGGRHRCLMSCTTPYAVSFDDDSYPVDADFFERAEQFFLQHSDAAVCGAVIWARHEPVRRRSESRIVVSSYIACGCAIRLAAYRAVRGLLPRPVPYGMEEIDLSLQLFAAGWKIYQAGDLRVFHDTELVHHASPEIVSGYVTNVGLFAFLNYPVIHWYWGLLQLANAIVFSVRRGRIRGLCTGLLRLPLDCYRNRHHREPIDWATVRRFLQFRRSEVSNMTT
jgi:GT2 family glycosyltransferase